MKYIAIIVVVLAIAIGAFAFVKYASAPVVTPEEETTNTPEGEPTFVWSYNEFTDEEIPNTTITLTATYPDGTEITKEIDTVGGHCNAYPEADDDVYLKSEMIICYYAGLGQYYKIVDRGGEYHVERKIFEEASPEYDPPVQEYETIAEF